MISRKYYKPRDIVILNANDSNHLETIEEVSENGIIIDGSSYEPSQLTLATFGNVMKTFKRKSTLKTFKLLQKKKFQLDIFIRIINEAFLEENVDIKINIDTAIVTIKFPKITVENEAGLTHDIFDFYVRFRIKSYGPSEYYISGFSGLKTSFTRSEIKENYMHSHLDYSTSDKVSFLSFCTGTGGFISLLNNISNYRLFDNMINDFELFIFSIEKFLSWESLEGGPYRNISKLSKYKTVSISGALSVSHSTIQQITNDVFLDIDREKSESEVSIINGDAFVVLKKDYINEICEKHLDKKLYTLDGNYYEENMSTEVDFQHAPPIKDYSFKGKYLQTKIIDQESSFEFKEEHLAINPAEARFVFRKINNDFINFQVLDYEPSRTKINEEASFIG